MDALSTTLVAGVIVAVVAAILAFVFNRVQEQQKLQRDLNERRAQAILEIRTRASSAGEALKGWAKRAGELHELAVELPAINPSMTEDDMHTYQRFNREAARVVQQKDDVINEMTSLRAYYHAQEPYLEVGVRKLTDNFDDEFTRRYTALPQSVEEMWAIQYADQAEDQIQDVDQAMEQAIEERASADTAPPRDPNPFLVVKGLWGMLTGKYRRQMREQMREYAETLERIRERLAKVSEAANYVQNWDLQPILAKFEAEAEGIAGMRR